MSNNSKHVLFVASECAPLCKSGGLADVVGSLPSALSKLHVKVSIILPYYNLLPDFIREKAVTVKESEIVLGLQTYYCGLKYCKYKNRQYYFIDNEQFFLRDALYGYQDEDERFLFFANAVLAMLPYIGSVDILHCHDWQSGAIALLLKMFYQHLPDYAHIKTVFTIHNLKYQGRFSIESAKQYLGIDENSPYFKDIEYYGDLNIMKSALYHSDYVTTVSPTYSNEILTHQYGEGLEGVLKDIEYKLEGIVNGLNVQSFNPASDSSIDYPFTDAPEKSKNKVSFFKQYGLDLPEDTMMIGIVTRLEEQKGLDLILEQINRMLHENICFVLLGTGNKNYEKAFARLEAENRQKVRCFIMYNEALAHKIYAASDLFLMPSLFEPCGIGQMIAMRYGSLPLVRETGGLKDTVIPYNQYTKEGTGFSFKNFNSQELYIVFSKAYELFTKDRATWKHLVENAMNSDFSWKISAGSYKRIYRFLE